MFVAILFAASAAAQDPVPQPPPQAPPAQTTQQTSTAPSPSAPKQVAVPIKTVRAIYPYEAERDQRQGQVIVKMIVDEQGNVVDVIAENGDPIFQKPALDAARKWKYQPYLKDGKPVRFSVRVPFNFAFTDRVDDKNLRKEIAEEASAAASGNSEVPQQPGAKIATPARIRVSQGVSEGLLLHKVTPVYPQQAKYKGVSGTVLLQAVITKEGFIGNLKVISGPKELQQSAVDAVSQWIYKPYRLMGNPVEVETTIQVNYTLSRF
jgi:TonB family protein